MGVIKWDQLTVQSEHGFECLVIAFPSLDVIGKMTKLGEANETGDLGRSEIETKVVEGILRVKFTAYVVFLTPLELLRGVQAAIPTIGAHDSQHLSQLLVISAYHAALDRRHVMRDEKGKGGSNTEIARLASR